MSTRLRDPAWKAAVKSDAKVVLVRLCDLAGLDTCESWPTINKLAEDCSITAGAVRRALSDLEAAGYISRRMEAGRRGMIYTINEARLM
jgi:DNA-binding MarR family transcriptional regulator